MSLVDLARFRSLLGDADDLPIVGRVVRIAGIVVEALLPQVAVGTACELEGRGGRRIAAEVVGFNGALALLVPFGDLHGIAEGCAVRPRPTSAEIPVGEALLGRVIDAAGAPIDDGPIPLLTARASLDADPPEPMRRRRISRRLSLGIRSIDAFLTLGEGQRVGVLAAPGVGKSSLIGMLARTSEADVVVVGLVGERGREVREFIERDLGPEGLAHSVVVVGTADQSPLVRVRAAMTATAVAEYFRGRGRRVLLLVDSLSRVAMAQREIGLAAGEPPTSRGYPPSVFAMLPRLLERAGTDAGEGSVTALYTLLVEDEMLSDPVLELARASLDGHLALSSKLAAKGHFPAVDVLRSVSRCMSDVVSPAHADLARDGRALLAAYEESADLVEVGAYRAGSNPRVDRALQAMDGLNGFLRQGREEHTPYEDMIRRLRRTLAPEARHA